MPLMGTAVMKVPIMTPSNDFLPSTLLKGVGYLYMSHGLNHSLFQLSRLSRSRISCTSADIATSPILERTSTFVDTVWIKKFPNQIRVTQVLELKQKNGESIFVSY